MEIQKGGFGAVMCAMRPYLNFFTSEQDGWGYCVPVVSARGGSRTPAVPGLMMRPPSVIDIGNPPIIGGSQMT